MKSYKPKHFKKATNKPTNQEFYNQLTIPEIYPNYRLPNSNIPITSDENVNYAKDWIEINKL